MCINFLSFLIGDYINFEKELLIEWDEEYHYKNNLLKEKDILRQKQIQEIFPSFKFCRIREKFLCD